MKTLLGIRPTKLIIIGRPISKKNSKQVFWRGGKPVVISSSAYRKFEKSALAQIPPFKTQKGDLVATYRFFIKGRYRVDLDNLIAGINDIMEKAGVIENDNNIMEILATKIGGCKDWKTIITLEIDTP